MGTNDTVAARAAEHPVTVASIECAVKNLRGRDREEETSLDRALRNCLRSFAAAVASFSLMHDSKAIMTAARIREEGWRARLADENYKQLYEGILSIRRFVECYEANMRKRRGVKHLPRPEIIRESFVRVASVVTQVVRMLENGHDPGWLYEAMPGEPHYKGPVSTRAPAAKLQPAETAEAAAKRQAAN